jgi:hypothetical protein
MKLSDVPFRYTLVRMGHSHGHHDHHEEELMRRCRELMHEDHRAVAARVEVAVAKMASPMWRIGHGVF